MVKNRHIEKKPKNKQLYLGDMLCKGTENYHNKVYKFWELKYRDEDGQVCSFNVAEFALRNEIFNRDGKTYKDDAGKELDETVDVYARATDTLDSVYEKIGKEFCQDLLKKDEEEYRSIELI